MSPIARSWIVFLHRWIGFPMGIGLFILFFTGSLATFSLEIQEWMQPQTAFTFPETKEGLNQAGLKLSHDNKEKKASFLIAPSKRNPVFYLWHYDGHTFRGSALNPTTGQILPTRDVVGGTFFITLHDCFYMPNIWGRILVSTAGIGILIALLTGVILQLKRFFPDLLLIRPHASSHRFWLDIHLLIGTLGLPILILISLSGTVLQIQTLIKELIPTHSYTSPSPPYAPPLPSNALSSLNEQGKILWGNTQGGLYIPIGGETFLFRPDHSTFCITRSHISATHPLPLATASCPTFHSILTGIHNMRWAGLSVRWLYFSMGVIGSILIASGLILFQKKQHKQLCRKKIISILLLRLITSLNTATIIGLPLATLGLLLSTRLPEVPNILSITLENSIFFTIWGMSFIHALIHNYAARIQSILLGFLGMGIIPFDILTRPLSLSHFKLFLSIDFCSLIIGIIGIFSYYKLKVA